MNKLPNHIVLFDGVCNLCNASVKYLLNYDRKKRLKFASLQSDIGREFIIRADESKNLDSPTTLIYYKNDMLYKRSDAVLELARDLGFPHSLVLFFKWLPKSWRDTIYDFIASKRYRWFGKQEYCDLSKKHVDPSRFIDADSFIYKHPERRSEFNP